MIDTHAHIYASEFDEDRDQIIAKAKESGISQILMPNIDLDSIKPMLATQAQYPAICHAMMGLHPCYVKADYKSHLDIIYDWFEKHPFIGVGEIGIDLYWDKTYHQEQLDAFKIQLNWAKQMQLPVVIHTRDSIDGTLSLIRQQQDGSLTGVFHCFGGTVEQGKKIQDLGFHLGLGGVTTFKNSQMDEVIPHLNMAQIILETDCPYLAPTPHRGKRNEPSFLRLIAQKIADINQTNIEVVIKQTTLNAKSLFNI